MSREALYLGLEQLGREVDHSPTSSAEPYLHSSTRLHAVALINTARNLFLFSLKYTALRKTQIKFPKRGNLSRRASGKPSVRQATAMLGEGSPEQQLWANQKE
jgi:hypothetical protein